MTYWYLDAAIGNSRDLYRQWMEEDYSKNPCKHLVYYGGEGVGGKWRGQPVCGRLEND